jgi:hypothetical protein
MFMDAAVPNEHGSGPQGGSAAVPHTPREPAQADLIASAIGYEAADPSLYPPLCGDAAPVERTPKRPR